MFIIMIIEWNKNHHFEGIPDAEISVGEGDFFTDQLWLRDLLPYKIKWFKEIAEKHFGLFKEEILQIEKDKKRIVGVGKTVHVASDKKSHTKIPLPDDLRKALKKFP